MYKIFTVFLLLTAVILAQDNTNATDPLDDHSLTCEEMRAHPELFFETGIDLGSGNLSPNEVDYGCKESIQNLPFMEEVVKFGYPRANTGSLRHALYRYYSFKLTGIGMHVQWFKEKNWQFDKLFYWTMKEHITFKNSLKPLALTSNLENYNLYMQYKKETDKALPLLIKHFRENFALSEKEATLHANFVMDSISLSFYVEICRRRDGDCEFLTLAPLADYVTNSNPKKEKIAQLLKKSTQEEIEQALKAAFLTKKEPMIIDLLLENFLEINRNMEYDEFPFHKDEPLIFLTFGYPEYTKKLLDKGADINSEDAFGETVLYRAIQYNNYDFAKFLIKNGADVNHKTKKDVYYNKNKYVPETTPLMTAVIECSSVEMLRLLVESRADVNALNKDNKTALDIAFGLRQYNNNATEVKLLDEKLVYLNSAGGEFADSKRYLEAAELYEKENNLHQAIQMYIKSTSFNPNAHNIYFKISNLYKKAGDTQKADEYLEKFREAYKSEHAQ
ncbi:MAG: ankyrin repeat domain-containing protein [Campylobacteraceae bacterium]|jgi:ankyrin repeat protein|nr:ankyrin repeat domain-containing protein [Campylobacteraceae bacterium]